MPTNRSCVAELAYNIWDKDVDEYYRIERRQPPLIPL